MFYVVFHYLYLVHYCCRHMGSQLWRANGVIRLCIIFFLTTYVMHMCTYCLLSRVLIAHTHRGMARLSWPGWLIVHRDGLPARRQLPILVLTGSGVAQLRWSRQTR